MLLKCAQCGNEFNRKPSEVTRNNYCCRKCYLKAKNGQPLRPVEERFWENVQKSEGCWIWTAFRNEQGYGRLKVNGKIIGAHRFSWILENGVIPNGRCVCHRCDNPSCVNPSHLFLGTQLDNMTDCAKKGRLKRGNDNGRAKLTVESVKRIRQMVSVGMNMCRVGKLFGVHNTTVLAIIHGRTWRHVH